MGHYLLLAVWCVHHSVHQTTLTLPLLIEVPVPSQESYHLCISVCSGYRFCLFLRYFLKNFGTVATVWYFLFFILLLKYMPLEHSIATIPLLQEVKLPIIQSSNFISFPSQEKRKGNGCRSGLPLPYSLAVSNREDLKNENGNSLCAKKEL